MILQTPKELTEMALFLNSFTYFVVFNHKLIEIVNFLVFGSVFLVLLLATSKYLLSYEQHFHFHIFIDCPKLLFYSYLSNKWGG